MVEFKSALTSNNVNTKFMSRTSDTGTTGRVNITNLSDAASPTDTTAAIHTAGGAAIEKDIQVGGAVNAATFNNLAKTFAIQNITPTGTIAIGNKQSIQVRRVQGDTTPVTTSGTPFGDLSSLDDGVIIILLGGHAVKSVKIPVSDVDYGFIGNGSCELFLGNTLMMIWDATAKRLFDLTVARA